MALLSVYPLFEINLMSNRKVIELLLQLKGAKAHGKNYIKVKPHLAGHLLRNHLYKLCYVEVPNRSKLLILVTETYMKNLR